MELELRRINVKALDNGFLIDADDYDYKDTELAFSTWEETAEWIKNNPPVRNAKPDTPSIAVEAIPN